MKWYVGYTRNRKSYIVGPFDSEESAKEEAEFIKLHNDCKSVGVFCVGENEEN